MNIRSKKTLISIAVFLGLSALLVVLIIYPLFKEIKKNSEEFVSKETELIQLQNEVKSLEESEALYRSRQKNVEKIDNLFVSMDLPIEFMKFLEENAARSQIDMAVAHGGESKDPKEPWPSIYFQITITGQFTQCLKFIEKLETGPYLVEILNLNVQRLQAGDVMVAIFIRVFAK